MSVIKGYPQSDSPSTDAKQVTVSEDGSKVGLDVSQHPVGIGDPNSVASGTSAASNFNSSSWDVENLLSGSMRVSWESINKNTGTIVLEGSNDGTNWDELSGSGYRINDTPEDSLIYEFTSFSTKEIRLAYTANTVTAGTITIDVWGKS